MKRSFIFDSAVQPSCTKLGVFMKKKKSMLGILALLLVFAFTACDNNPDDNTANPLTNTFWRGENYRAIRFPGGNTWDGMVNPILSGRFTYNGNTAYIEVTHKDGNPVTGIGMGIISGGNLIFTITIGDEEFSVTVTKNAGYDGTETLPAIQGVWTPVGAGNNNWFILTGFQSGIFSGDTNTFIGATRARFSLLNEFCVNDELDNRGIFSPNRVVPFQMSFYDVYTGAIMGHISGFWVDDDGTIENQLFVITDRVVRQSARDYVIPLEGVYIR